MTTSSTISYEDAVRIYKEWAESKGLLSMESSETSSDTDDNGVWHLCNVDGEIASVAPDGSVGDEALAQLDACIAELDEMTKKMLGPCSVCGQQATGTVLFSLDVHSRHIDFDDGEELCDLHEVSMCAECCPDDYLRQRPELLLLFNQVLGEYFAELSHE